MTIPDVQNWPDYRGIGLADPRIAGFTVTAASDESIHHHGAFARLSWPGE